MFNKIKTVFQQTAEQLDTKTKLNTKTSRDSFAGASKKDIARQLASDVPTDLSVARVGKNAQNSLKSYSSKTLIDPNLPIEEAVANIYSEGDYRLAIDSLKTFINKHKGTVDKKIWFMLLDVYEAVEDKESFEKTALAYANSFGTSPPSWIKTTTENKSIMAGKNILFLSSFKQDDVNHFKDFIKASKEEKFCRLNISQLNFGNVSLSSLKLFHKLLTDIRKIKVKTLFIGEVELINFCKSYINPNNTKNLNPIFVENESFFWILLLEIYQWFGKYDEFKDLAYAYATKFELSPPGWDNDGSIILSSNEDESTTNNQQENIPKEINPSNINIFLDIISNRIISNNLEIDCSEIIRFDFSAAGEISHFIQSFWEKNPNLNNVKIVLKNINEPILTLFHSLGTTEFVSIIPKKR